GCPGITLLPRQIRSNAERRQGVVIQDGGHGPSLADPQAAGRDARDVDDEALVRLGEVVAADRDADGSGWGNVLGIRARQRDTNAGQRQVVDAPAAADVAWGGRGAAIAGGVGVI